MLLLVLLALLVGAPVTARSPLPFQPGERLTMKLSYASIVAGRASLVVRQVTRDGRSVLQFETRARSEGFFSDLFDFRVRDRTRATWDPESGCSLEIEKRLREGRAVRDQLVTFDQAEGVAYVDDPKIDAESFEIGPCALDVLSALFVTRLRGVPENGSLRLPLFDNGKDYHLEVRFLRRETLDLPEPFGPDTPTIVLEPMLVEGTGLFVQRGRLEVWLTDDERRVPVRWSSKVPIGAVVGQVEAYQPGVAR